MFICYFFYFFSLLSSFFLRVEDVATVQMCAVSALIAVVRLRTDVFPLPFSS